LTRPFIYLFWAFYLQIQVLRFDTVDERHVAGRNLEASLKLRANACSCLNPETGEGLVRERAARPEVRLESRLRDQRDPDQGLDPHRRNSLNSVHVSSTPSSTDVTNCAGLPFY
jgi:hypothetical protein